jgi:hypothetical protein
MLVPPDNLADYRCPLVNKVDADVTICIFCRRSPVCAPSGVDGPAAAPYGMVVDGFSDDDLATFPMA